MGQVSLLEYYAIVRHYSSRYRCTFSMRRGGVYYNNEVSYTKEGGIDEKV